MASLGPELIAEIGGMPITNTLITTLVVDIIVVALVIATYKKVSLIPSSLQSIFEPIISYMYDLTQQISGYKAKTIFPWFASFFLFILFANILGLFPGFGTVGIWREGSPHETESKKETSHTQDTLTATTPNLENEMVAVTDAHTENEAIQKTNSQPPKEKAHDSEKHLVPVLRAATSDFNMTLALGTISIIATHAISIRYNGFFGYLKKFLSKNPINLFIGLLEFALEGVKIFSLSFRLFGNIFAGEVVLITVAGLAAYSAFLAPIPFILLEVIVALVQASVFAMLTMVFMSLLATTSSEGGGH